MVRRGGGNKTKEYSRELKTVGLDSDPTTYLSSAADNQNNRSVCAKSMKIGTLVAKGMPKRFGYGGVLNFQQGAHGSHFTKWPPTTVVFL